MERETIQKRLEIISSPLMSKKDLMSYFGVCRSSAEQIKDSAVKNYDGAVEYNNRKIKTESVFKAMGLNREKEIANLKKASEAIQG